MFTRIAYMWVWSTWWMLWPHYTEFYDEMFEINEWYFRFGPYHSFGYKALDF